MYKPHAAAGSGVCLCFELVFAPFLHIIGWLLINQSGALIICLFVYCCGLVFAPFLLILPQIQCANFAILKHFQRGFGEPSYIYQIHKIIAKKQIMMANLS